jgi:aldehyde dehydrogenase (NAD+)
MSILSELGVENVSLGTCLGANAWSGDGERTITSVNPANGDVIGQVKVTTSDEYERLMVRAVEVAGDWAKIPAPKRGEAVRLIGDALRRNKDNLGSLISLEMGKIKAEGDGEVQEAIDIAEFAVGQSRMMYGKTMHSERPDHRMYEQWHPLGVVGVITAFNFPMAVWAWNACISAICGNVTVWKPSPKTPFCALALQTVCNEVLEENGFPPIDLSMIGALTWFHLPDRQTSVDWWLRQWASDWGSAFLNSVVIMRSSWMNRRIST